jgi:hypothetical protein
MAQVQPCTPHEQHGQRLAGSDCNQAVPGHRSLDAQMFGIAPGQHRSC